MSRDQTLVKLVDKLPEIVLVESTQPSEVPKVRDARSAATAEEGLETKVCGVPASEHFQEMESALGQHDEAGPVLVTQPGAPSSRCVEELDSPGYGKSRRGAPTS